MEYLAGFISGVLFVCLSAVLSLAIGVRAARTDRRWEDGLPTAVRRQLWEDEILEIIRGKGQ